MIFIWLLIMCTNALADNINMEFQSYEEVKPDCTYNSDKKCRYDENNQEHCVIIMNNNCR